MRCKILYTNEKSACYEIPASAFLGKAWQMYQFYLVSYNLYSSHVMGK